MENQEMRLIRERFVQKNIHEDDVKRAEEIVNRLIPGDTPGAFRLSGIDYSICLNANWPTSNELDAVITLASAWKQSEEEMYQIAAIGILDDWLLHRYHNPNWWHNEIGVPMKAAEIALLLWDDLDDERHKGILEVLEQGTFNKHPEFSKKWTGANLIWEAGNTVKAAILEEDEALLIATVKRMEEEIKYADEGIQKDGSFFQHGPLLYSGGYGRSFLSMLSGILPALSGTKYQFSKEKLDMLAFVLLDGLRYMTHRDVMDGAISGREYTRKGALGLRGFLPALDAFLATEEMPRKDEIQEYRDAIDGRKTIPSLQGPHFFPIAKFLTNRVGECYFSFKGIDEKTLCTEICNEEGVLGYNFSYGTRTTFMRSGKEYYDIYAVYDYARIPGTTAPADDDETLYQRPNFNGRKLEGRCFGGRSFNGVGVCFEEADHEGIHAKVACFAVPDGMILLGTDISSEKKEELYTTAEQCHADVIQIEENDVLHGGICYRNLDPETEWNAEIRTQTGCWKRNNRQSSRSEEISARVFHLMIDRKGKDSYAYGVFPVEKRENDYKVLQNDKNAQAILLPDGRICAIIYKAGHYHWNNTEINGEKYAAILCKTSMQ